MTTRLGRHDLVLSHYSLATDTPFEERLAAAAGAGFAGIGWSVREYALYRDVGGDDAAIGRALADHGLVLHEIDALPLHRLTYVDAAVHLATTFGVHHVQVQGDRPGTVAEAAATIAGIADRVAPSGAGVAIEFLGCNNITTAADALVLAELSERPNVGVQVDIWHHVRGANDWAMLDSLPSDRIASVQVDDGPLTAVDPDYLVDTTHHRCAPGEGQFDLRRFLATVHRPDVDVPLSLEVIDDDLLALPAAEAARRMADGMRAVLRALAPTPPA